jgi:hypothetical protein
VDVTSLTTLLGSIKTAADIAKLIKDSGVTLEQAEVKLKLAELISALADAKMETAEIQANIAARDDKIRELEKAATIRGAVKYQDPAYWLTSAAGEDGPYCQHCYDSDSKLVRLQDELNGAWGCRVCKNQFFEPQRRASDEAQFNTPIQYPRSGY